MLTLSRKNGERIIILVGDTRIVIQVSIRTLDKVRLSFDAGPEVCILREELEARL